MTPIKLKSTLRKAGHRVTQSRVVTYKILKDSNQALSPKEAFEKASDMNAPSVDLVSMYRNLNLFVELGLAHRLQDGRYSYCEQESTCQEHPHLHIITSCLSCGSSHEVKSHTQSVCHFADELAKVPIALRKLSQVVIQGLCPACS